MKLCAFGANIPPAVSESPSNHRAPDGMRKRSEPIASDTSDARK